MNYSTKYECGHLVEYTFDQTETENRFGIIQAITFYKYDAVNYGARFAIHQVNGGKVDHDVSEKEIIRRYGVCE